MAIATTNKGNRKLKQVLIFFSVSVFIIIYMISDRARVKITEDKIKDAVDHKIPKACRIPYLDPYHNAMQEYAKIGAPLLCNKSDQLIVPGKNPNIPTLIFNRNLTSQYGNDVKCVYYSLRRQNDWKVNWMKRIKFINRGVVLVKDEFIRAVCYNNYQKIFEEYFHFIQRKPEVERRFERIKELKGFNNREKKLSVLFLFIDSVSRNHFLRQMKKTDQYLRKFTTMADMKLVNKIGRSTFHIFVKLLLGRTWRQTRLLFKLYSNDSLDRLPFVWKDFAEAGYRVLFAEDVSTFQSKTKGFKKEPTDYYFHPFLLAILKNPKSYVKFACLNSKPFADVILKWTQDFFDVFSPDPLFAFVKLSILSHDTPETLYKYDDPIYRFIKHLNIHNHLNNSVVFFMSDHGPSYGKFRCTFEGRMESKLPFLFVLYPQWFNSKYPKMVSNLKINADRLTTARDIHATVMDILKFSETTHEQINSKGPEFGIFRAVIPENRTCEEALIPKQFCACDDREDISVTDTEVTKAAVILLKSVNNFTETYRSNCSFFILKKILSASFQKSYADNGRILRYHYQLTIEVYPGGGMFEGTITRSRFTNLYYIDPNIERVNQFGNQSSCINDGFIKPYCYCYR